MNELDLEVIMLVGLPATGKSTWIYDNGYYSTLSHMILSTDNFIESVALGENKTYNEVFDLAVKDAERHLKSCLDVAIEHKLSLIWDQTNLSASSRRKKLLQVPMNYKRIAMVFQPNEHHAEWLSQREGKTIPFHIMESMKKSFEMPTLHEGFDSIIMAELYGI
jgi:predicted kinase